MNVAIQFLRQASLWRRAAGRVAGFAIAVLAAGCAGLPQAVDRPVSFAPTDAADTTLARQVRADSAESHQLSGLRLLPMPQYSMHARLELARRAERSIDVQYYLLQNDVTGHVLLRTLRDAALRGVRVRVLIDDLYTAGADPLLTGFAAYPNVEVRLFNPFPAGRAKLATRLIASAFDFDRIHRRMHNKLYVVDNAMAVMGGRNIANGYFLRDAGSNFIDIDTLVAGAVVLRLSSLFDMYWNSPYVYPIASLAPDDAAPEERRARFDRLTADATAAPPEASGSRDLLGYRALGEDLDAGQLGLTWAPAEAYADAPYKALGPLEARPSMAMGPSPDSVLFNVRRMVRAAQRDVLVTTPYLIPGRGGMESVRLLHERGVRFTLVTNSLAATDESLVHLGYRRYRPDLLRNGVQLYELSPKRVEQAQRFGMFGSASGRLHGKAAVVDGQWAFIGSLNFDPRSDLHNTELGLFIHSPQIAAQMTSLIGFITMDAAYRVRLDAKGELEWVIPSPDGGPDVVLNEEPETDFGSRLKLDLLAPLIPESLL